LLDGHGDGPDIEDFACEPVDTLNFEDLVVRVRELKILELYIRLLLAI
jgi:hypothetical protein